MTAKTLSCSTSFLTAASALVGAWPSSSNTATILRPLTPPAALVSLIASNMPSRPARPMYAAGPVIGPCAPMVIVSAVTPCCWAATGSATASNATAAASSSLFMVLLLWPMSTLGTTDWALRIVACEASCQYGSAAILEAPQEDSLSRAAHALPNPGSPREDNMQ